jgi:NAD(P)-dependent dehydrogenase (short-subunit alcohol dehydrogenase family)
MAAPAPRQRFAGKSVFVTGAAQGIGRAIAEAFLAEGASVAAVDVDEALLAAWTGAAAAAGAGAGGAARAPVLAIRCDVSVEAEVAAAVDAAAAAHGGLDVIVNNAAAFVYGTAESVTGGDWDKVLGVNVKGAAFTVKAGLRHLRARGPGGAIVNIASISSFVAQEHFLPYATTKGAIAQLTRNIAADIAKDGIRCNAVAPGPILTEATARHAASLGKTLDDIVGDLTSHLLLKRMGTPAEVASAVLFLASADAAFTTGATLMVDGGYTVA